MEQFERAEQTLVRALDDAQRGGIQDGQLLGDLQRSLGYALLRSGRPNEAVPHTREAVRIFSKIHGPESGEVGSCLVNLGAQLDAQGHTDQAIEIFQRALAMLRTVGDQDADVARALNNLATGYARIGRDDESEKMHRQALPLHRKLYGDVSFQTALSCENLAWAIIRRGALDEAEPYVNEAIETYILIFGEQHSHTAYAIHVRGDLLMGRCQYADAENEYRRALSIFRRVFPGAHRAIATELESVALARLEQSDFQGAEELFREMLVHRRQLQGEENLDYAKALNNFGVFLTRIGEADEAALSIESAIRLAQRLAGNDSSLALAWRRNRAGMLALRGDSDGALQELRDLVKDYESAREPNPVDAALAREQLGEQLTAQARRHWEISPADAERMSDEAHDYLRQSLAELSPILPVDHWSVLRTRCALADVLSEKAWRHATPDMLDQSMTEAQRARALAQEAFDAVALRQCADPYVRALVKSRLGAAQLEIGLVQRALHATTDSDHTTAAPPFDPVAIEQMLISACEDWKRIGLRTSSDRRNLRLVLTWLGRLYAAIPQLGDDPQRAADLDRWRALADD